MHTYTCRALFVWPYLPFFPRHTNPFPALLSLQRRASVPDPGGGACPPGTVEQPRHVRVGRSQSARLLQRRHRPQPLPVRPELHQRLPQPRVGALCHGPRTEKDGLVKPGGGCTEQLATVGRASVGPDA
eukprot:scaffold2397_cov113-Isochrysis_galbana.AAC.2